MQIIATYAGLLALLFVVLSIRVIGVRRSARVALGDGGDENLRRRIRAHANFAEYVPIALILMGLAEGLKADTRLLHGLGIALVVGRTIHAVGVSRSPENLNLRVGGMTATFTVLVVAAICCLFLAVRH